MNDDYLKFAENYSVSHMNNSKWRKLFIAWAKSGLEIEYSVWSFIDSEYEEVHRLPREYDISDTRFADGHFQPFESSLYRPMGPY